MATTYSTERVRFSQLAVGDTVLVWLGRKGNQPAKVTHLVPITDSGHQIVVTPLGNKVLGAGGTVQRVALAELPSGPVTDRIAALDQAVRNA